VFSAADRVRCRLAAWKRLSGRRKNSQFGCEYLKVANPRRTQTIGGSEAQPGRVQRFMQQAPGWHAPCNGYVEPVLGLSPRFELVPAQSAMKGPNMRTSLPSRTQSRRPIRPDLAADDRDPGNPWHWMPVLFPGLNTQQLEALMREVDQRPYTPPDWLTRPRLGRTPTAQQTEAGEPDRDPTNPLHWMPVLPPAVSLAQREAEAEALGLN
jgi:hypothetical protein